MELQLPSVVKDHNSKTAIVYKQGRKFIYLIPMKSGKLTIVKLTAYQYDKKQYTVLDTPVSAALLTYVRHAGGHTESARQALEAIMKEVWE